MTDMVRPQATTLQPLFSNALGGKYYGLGFFAGKRPVTIFQVEEKDAFKMPDGVTNKHDQRKLAIAHLLTCKLKLTRYGREIFETSEHSYHNITKAVVSKFKVDVDAKIERGATQKESKDAFAEAMALIEAKNFGKK